MHLGDVVAAEETTNLESTAAGLREGGVDTHLLEACSGEKVGTCCIILITRCINFDMIHHQTWVIEVDDSLFLDGRLVATAIAIND